jgi:hypothetical protein
LDVNGRRESATNVASVAPLGVQPLPRTIMPPPPARPSPVGTGSWQARMAKGRQVHSDRPLPYPLGEQGSQHGRPAHGRGKRARSLPPARADRDAAAQPPTSGWSGDWQVATGVPEDGAEVVVVYAIGSGKQARREWCLGTVSLGVGRTLAVFDDGSRFILDPAQRLNLRTDPVTAVRDQWCLLAQVLP